MMKMRSKFKNSFLTAAILLAVSGGSVYAMPTGGNVTMGNVTNVANPAELMTANANSIINWDSFSVGVGEKVTFDTQKFMVLNRVVGGQESQILGMLSDQGQGKLLLINPAGIVLGENAVINANDLVLSTLRLSDDEFKNLVNGNRAVFKDENNDRGKIEIKSGTNLTLNEALRLYGGKITIADGVEIISKENSSADIKISAGVEEITDLKDVSWTTYDIGTNVEIGDANIGTMSNPISDITIKADKTTLDKTDVVVNGNDNSRHNILIGSKITDINSSKLLNRSGDIFIANISRGSWSYDNDGSIKTFEAEADPNYEVAIRNSNINTVKAKDITIIGGNVTLDHSQLNSGKDIFVGAVKTYDSKEGVRTATTYDNSVINADKDTVVHARGHAEAYGANLNIQAKKFDNVIDSTNPIVKYIGKDGVSLWELMPYIDKEGDINLDYYYNNLNGKTLDELIMMQLDNRKKGIIDKDLDAIIEYLQKKANEQNEHISSDDVNKNNTEKDEASDNPWGMDDLFVDLLDGGGEFLTEGEGKLYNTLNIGENVGKLTVDVCKLGRVIFKKDIPEEEKRDAMSEVVKSTGELVGSIWEAGHEKGAGKIFSCVTKLITDASSIDYAHLLEMSPQERTEVGGKLMKDALELNPLADNDPLNNFLKGIVDGVVYVGSNEYKNKVLADKQVTSDEIAKVPLIIFYQGLKSVPENTPWLKSGINATKTLVEKIITHSGENIGGGNGGGGGAAGGR